MAKREFIVYGFGANRRYMLGYFLCQPVDAKKKQPTYVSFDDLAEVELYFDPELLDYILVIDESDILPPVDIPD